MSLQSNTNVEDFLKEIEGKDVYEDKLGVAITYMHKLLSQEKQVDFKSFWEIKSNCLSFFKESLNPVVREKLWNEFVILTKEAKKLKGMLEEQKVFAQQQIDLAIQALEKDEANYESVLTQMPEVAFPREGKFLSAKYKEYGIFQRELNLLNAFANRINALRKEILQIDLKLRFKSKFFKKLSQLGNNIFDKRKSFIKDISHNFEQDIISFVDIFFENKTKTLPGFVLKNEIKVLQKIAKILTLNTKAFSFSRLKLSKCWDHLIEVEKESKKLYLEKKERLETHNSLVLNKIFEFEKQCESLSYDEVKLECEKISKYMGEIQLKQADIKNLKNLLNNFLHKSLEKEKQKKREIEEREKEKLLIRQNKLNTMKEEMQELVNSSVDLSDLLEKKEEIEKKCVDLKLNNLEKKELNKSLRLLKDVIIEKKEKLLLEKGEWKEIKEILDQKIQRRIEIKQQIEEYRKILGSSGLDFEKAIKYNEMSKQEKDSLDKLDASIEFLKNKIGDFE